MIHSDLHLECKVEGTMNLNEFILPTIIGLSIPVMVVFIARLMTWRMFPQARQAEEDLNRARKWNCRECGHEFGAESMIIFSGGTEQGNTMMIDGKPFAKWFVAVCAHCKMLRCFDGNGQPWAIPGELFEGERNGQQSRTARRTSAPL